VIISGKRVVICLLNLDAGNSMAMTRLFDNFLAGRFRRCFGRYIQVKLAGGLGMPRFKHCKVRLKNVVIMNTVYKKDTTSLSRTPCSTQFEC